MFVWHFPTGFFFGSVAGICYEIRPSSENNVPWYYQNGIKYLWLSLPKQSNSGSLGVSKRSY